MYYPYFRGKQYELITIRETAAVLAAMNFVPIIEPVKKETNSLEKTLDRLCEENTRAIIVVNPQIGFHSDDSTSLITLVNERYRDRANLIFGLLLTENINIGEAIAYCDEYDNREIALIHSGFSEARQLAEAIRDRVNINISVFIDRYCGKLYQKHFDFHENKILVRDGFKIRRNRDHPETEIFSDLHATYTLEGMNGFGDFLIVGDEYFESGGPAYTIAIHLTYIDSEKDDEMHIRHFKSDRQDTPKDPAGKFAEALNKLIGALGKDDNKITETSAIREFRDLHDRGHYPGLGYVKKLSMKHHIETLATYFGGPGPAG